MKPNARETVYWGVGWGGARNGLGREEGFKSNLPQSSPAEEGHGGELDLGEEHPILRMEFHSQRRVSDPRRLMKNILKRNLVASVGGITN